MKYILHAFCHNLCPRRGTTGVAGLRTDLSPVWAPSRKVGCVGGWVDGLSAPSQLHISDSSTPPTHLPKNPNLKVLASPWCNLLEH